jgi:hypothetical protein
MRLLVPKRWLHMALIWLVNASATSSLSVVNYFHEESIIKSTYWNMFCFLAVLDIMIGLRVLILEPLVNTKINSQIIFRYTYVTIPHAPINKIACYDNNRFWDVKLWLNSWSKRTYVCKLQKENLWHRRGKGKWSGKLGFHLTGKAPVI